MGIKAFEISEVNDLLNGIIKPEEIRAVAPETLLAAPDLARFLGRKLFRCGDHLFMQEEELYEPPESIMYCTVNETCIKENPKI